MTEITFESGRVFHIENDQQAVYILQGSSSSPNEDRRKALIDSYVWLGGLGAFNNISDAIKEKKSDERLENELIEDCLFKDVDEYGERKMCNIMAGFLYDMFYIQNGLSAPDGPLPWGDFE